MTSVDSGKLREVTPYIAYDTNQIVNLMMTGFPGSDWVLVDAGMPASGKEIPNKWASYLLTFSFKCQY